MDLNKLNKYKDKSEFIEDVKNRTFETEMKYHGCCQVIVHTFLDVFEEDNANTVSETSDGHRITKQTTSYHGICRKCIKISQQ